MANTSGHYDIRGITSLRRKDSLYGSSRFPLWASSPYSDLEKLINHATEGQTFLDLCCGTGIHSIHPAKQGYLVVGVDISPISIEAARDLAVKNELTGKCEFLCSTADTAVGRENIYDTILVSGSLYYLDYQSLLPAIIISLKNGGRFLCVETNGDNFIMKVVRYLRARILKDRDLPTLNALLGRSDVKAICSLFPESSVTYYDFFTLAGVFLSWWPAAAAAYYRLASKADNKILQFSLFQRIAFKFLIIGKKTSN